MGLLSVALCCSILPPLPVGIRVFVAFLCNVTNRAGLWGPNPAPSQPPAAPRDGAAPAGSLLEPWHASAEVLVSCRRGFAVDEQRRACQSWGTVPQVAHP